MKSYAFHTFWVSRQFRPWRQKWPPLFSQNPITLEVIVNQCVSFNSISPHIEKLPDLHSFSYGFSWENLLTDQTNFPLVIILSILITLPLYRVLILWGDIWCWSLLGLEQGPRSRGGGVRGAWALPIISKNSNSNKITVRSTHFVVTPVVNEGGVVLA